MSAGVANNTSIHRNSSVLENWLSSLRTTESRVYRSRTLTKGCLGKTALNAKLLGIHILIAVVTLIRSCCCCKGRNISRVSVNTPSSSSSRSAEPSQSPHVLVQPATSRPRAPGGPSVPPTPDPSAIGRSGMVIARPVPTADSGSMFVVRGSQRPPASDGVAMVMAAEQPRTADDTYRTIIRRSPSQSSMPAQAGMVLQAAAAAPAAHPTVTVSAQTTSDVARGTSILASTSSQRGSEPSMFMAAVPAHVLATAVVEPTSSVSKPRAGSSPQLLPPSSSSPSTSLALGTTTSSDQPSSSAAATTIASSNSNSTATPDSPVLMPEIYN